MVTIPESRHGSVFPLNSFIFNEFFLGYFGLSSVADPGGGRAWVVNLPYLVVDLWLGSLALVWIFTHMTFLQAFSCKNVHLHKN